MIEVNVSEGLGPVWRDRLGDLGRFRPLLIGAPAVSVDGRMMPHEWLATPRGLLKADATDHGDDHFLPGPQDIAWDVAGFAMEFGLAAGRTRDFAEYVAILSGDRRLPERLPFHRVAYGACRLGYTTLAAQTLGNSADGQRMKALTQRYRRQLALSIVRLGDSVGTSISLPNRRRPPALSPAERSSGIVPERSSTEIPRPT